MTKKILKHICFILDGNKRWAKINNLKEIEGYKKGIENIYEVVSYCYKNEIKYVTLYLLSTENIKRKNTKSFFKLAKNSFKDFIHNIQKIGDVNINFIGEKNNLPKDILDLVNQIEVNSFKNSKLTLNVAFNYGFIEELKSVMKNIHDYSINKKISIENINIDNFFYLKNQPDPDIMIRTGGYKRISNFILKNLIYTEIYFIETLWPDFNLKQLDKIILDYKKIVRNYGL